MRVREPKRAKWTVLYYIDGKNNLAPFALRAFQSLKEEGSDENVNLVAMVGIKIGKHEEVVEGKIPSKEELRNLRGDDSVLGDLFPGAQEMGNLNMGDPKTLKEFLIRNIRKYLAEHYALVLWDHGAGFKGSMVDEGAGQLIDNKELRQVLKEVMKETGTKIDIIQFNACLMGQTEVMNELEGTTDYVVASPETQAAIGLPIPGVYGTTPQHLVIRDLKQGIKERGQITPEELAKLYVFESRMQFGAKVFTPTMGAYNMRAIGRVRESIDELAKALIADFREHPERIEHFRNLVKRRVQHYLALDLLAEPYKDFVDVGHLAALLQEDKSFSERVRKAAKNLRRALDEFIIAEEHVDETQHGRPLAASTGLSIYLPTDYGYDPQGSNPIDNVPVGGTHGYERLSFAKATHWDELLKLISRDDDLIGKTPKLARALEKLMGYVKMAGYEEAKNVLLGKRSVEPFTFLGFKIPFLSTALGYLSVAATAIGGAFKALRGLEKLHFGIVNRKQIDELDPKHKAELLANGVIDTVIGIGSVALATGLIMGSAGALIPIAGLILGLGAGRLGVEIFRGYRKAKKAKEMTVTQKLEYVDSHKHLTQPV